MPRRRCVGCGRIAPKPELLRIAVQRPARDGMPARAVADAAAVMPGRGAYLCRAAGGRQAPAGACLRRAIDRNALSRTLRARVSLGPELVESGVR